MIAVAAAVPSEEEALFLVGALEVLATLHAQEAPLERLAVDDGVVSGRDRRDGVVLPLPDDYVSWTEETAGVFEAYAPRRGRTSGCAAASRPGPASRSRLSGSASHEEAR